MVLLFWYFAMYVCLCIYIFIFPTALNYRLSSWTSSQSRCVFSPDMSATCVCMFMHLLVFTIPVQHVSSSLVPFAYKLISALQGLKMLGQSIESSYSGIQKLVISHLQRCLDMSGISWLLPVWIHSISLHHIHLMHVPWMIPDILWTNHHLAIVFPSLQYLDCYVV